MALEAGETQNLVEQFNAIAAELDAKEAKGAPVKPEPVKANSEDAAEKQEPSEEAATETAETAEDEKGSATKGKKFRDWKRAEKQKLAEREAKIAERERALASKPIEPGALTIAQLRQTFDEDKDDDFFKSLGFKDANDYVQHRVRRAASPEYKRIRQLEQEREAEKAQRAKEQQERQQQEQQQALSAQQKRDVETVKTELAKHEDADVVGLAGEDSEFVEAVYFTTLQKLYPQGPTGVAADPEDIEEAFKESVQEIKERARKKYETLSKFFGDRPTSKDATPVRAGSRQQPAAKHVSKQKGTEAASSAKEMTDKEWLAFAEQELNRAHAENAREEKQRKSA